MEAPRSVRPAMAHGAPRPEERRIAAAADAGGPLDLALGPGDRRAPPPAPGPGPRLLRAQAARQSERTINLDPRRGADPGPERPAAGGLGGRREHLRRARRTSRARRAPAAALARALGLDAAGRKELLAQLQKNRAFVWVKRKVDPATARAVRELSAATASASSTENRRYYPKRELASQVLGYVGHRQHRHERHRVRLRGRDQGPRREGAGRDRRAAPARGPHRAALDRGPRRVVLTLDESIQHAAETELERADGRDPVASRASWW